VFTDFSKVFAPGEGLTRMDIEMGSEAGIASTPMEYDLTLPDGTKIHHFILKISAEDDIGKIPGGFIDCHKPTEEELKDTTCSLTPRILCQREDDGGKFCLSWPLDDPSKSGATTFSTRYFFLGTKDENVIMDAQNRDDKGRFTEPQIEFSGTRYEGKLCKEISAVHIEKATPQGTPTKPAPGKNKVEKGGAPSSK
jgi:hypothetical protein